MGIFYEHYTLVKALRVPAPQSSAFQNEYFNNFITFAPTSTQDAQIRPFTFPRPFPVWIHVQTRSAPPGRRRFA